MTQPAKKPADAIPPPGKHGLVRPVGDPEDRVFEIALDDADVILLNQEMHSDLAELDSLKDNLAKLKKNYASQISAKETAIRDIRRKISSRTDRRTVQVQPWLTKGNEIVTVAIASQIVIGEARTATAAELQEPLPLHDDDPPFGRSATSTPSDADRAALPAL